MTPQVDRRKCIYRATRDAVEGRATDERKAVPACELELPVSQRY
jgi:hypothetical protein